jgi:catechol 2,3-dioxygenase-like lactoylglutathione lyase family enzyme
MNAVGIVTADMLRSLEFYKILGLPTPEYNEGDDHFECDLGNGVKLMWDTTELAKEFLPGYVHGNGGSIGLAFECPSPAEVDEAHWKLTDAGFATLAAPWDAFWGQRYAIVADPDGNAISLYAALAPSPAG